MYEDGSTAADCKPRLNLERKFQQAIVQELYAAGYAVTEEYPMVRVGGRCDIMASMGPGYPVHLIEVKTSDPLKGVGQLLAYSAAGWPTTPNLVLAIPWGLMDLMLLSACKVAGIQVWSGDPPNPNDLILPLPEVKNAEKHRVLISDKNGSKDNYKPLMECTADNLKATIESCEARSEALRHNIGSYVGLRQRLMACHGVTVCDLYRKSA